MKTRTKNIMGVAFFTFVLFFVSSVSSSIYAQTPQRDYNVIAPLPGISVPCTNSSGQPSDCSTLDRYLPNAFNLAVGIAVAMAFVMITFGGVTYATSDALSGKQQGREYIENAIYGLLLVIGSYIILYTINPQIVRFDLLIPRPNVQQGNPTVTPVTPSGACTGGCLPFAGSGLTTSGGNVSAAGVSSILMPKLLDLNSQLNANNIPWRITEGYPPTEGVNHACDCHRKGTCVDAYPLKRTDPATLNTFVTYARQSNLNVEFEVKTEEEKFNLTSTVTRDGRPRTNQDGTPFVPYTGIIKVVPKINGAHFSVYNTTCNG